jgi:hypothetical protein
VDRFVEQHNLQFGFENPIDLRIARAQAGATNLIWIMRKALRWRKTRRQGPCIDRRIGFFVSENGIKWGISRYRS